MPICINAFGFFIANKGGVHFRLFLFKLVVNCKGFEKLPHFLLIFEKV